MQMQGLQLHPLHRFVLSGEAQQYQQPVVGPSSGTPNKRHLHDQDTSPSGECLPVRGKLVSAVTRCVTRPCCFPFCCHPARACLLYPACLLLRCLRCHAVNGHEVVAARRRVPVPLPVPASLHTALLLWRGRCPQPQALYTQQCHAYVACCWLAATLEAGAAAAPGLPAQQMGL